MLSHDPKGGRAYCVIVGPDGAAARLGTGLNGTINNENVNGCVRGTFASEAAQCP